jgi:hypothetical protein
MNAAAIDLIWLMSFKVVPLSARTRVSMPLPTGFTWVLMDKW